MACNEVSYWRKTLMRRQFLTAKHSHPWIIEFTSRLQEYIFKHIVDILTSTSRFGVDTHTGRTNKEQVVEITSKPKLQQMFLPGQWEYHFEAGISGKGKDKHCYWQRGPLHYHLQLWNEVVKVHCHYGAWNSDNVPQFVWHYLRILGNCLSWWGRGGGHGILPMLVYRGATEGIKTWPSFRIRP